jgi:hypothetical protein
MRFNCLEVAYSTFSNKVERVQRQFSTLCYNQPTASVVYWSEFLATDTEARVRFPALQEKKVVGLERGPLSLVSTTEELLKRKVAAPV